MKKAKQKQCKNCKTLFEPTYLHRVYCSHTCFEEYQLKKRKHLQVRRRIIKAKSIKHKEYTCPRCGMSYAKVHRLDRFETGGYAYFYCACGDSHPETVAVL